VEYQAPFYAAIFGALNGTRTFNKLLKESTLCRSTFTDRPTIWLN
jgi:hypothetical protein